MTAAALTMCEYYSARLAADPTSPHRADWEWQMHRFARIAGGVVA